MRKNSKNFSKIFERILAQKPGGRPMLLSTHSVTAVCNVHLICTEYENRWFQRYFNQGPLGPALLCIPASLLHSWAKRISFVFFFLSFIIFSFLCIFPLSFFSFECLLFFCEDLLWDDYSKNSVSKHACVGIEEKSFFPLFLRFGFWKSRETIVVLRTILPLNTPGLCTPGQTSPLPRSLWAQLQPSPRTQTPSWNLYFPGDFFSISIDSDFSIRIFFGIPS